MPYFISYINVKFQWLMRILQKIPKRCPNCKGYQKHLGWEKIIFPLRGYMFTSCIKNLGTFDQNWHHRNLLRVSIVCSIDNRSLGFKKLLLEFNWLLLVSYFHNIYPIHICSRGKEKFVKKDGDGKKLDT